MRPKKSKIFGPRNLKKFLGSKRGESNLEIIISFVLFIFILGFMLYYLIPLREQTVPDVLIDMVKKALDEQATIKIQEITLAGDSEQATIRAGGQGGIKIARWNEGENSWRLMVSFPGPHFPSIPNLNIFCPNGEIKTISTSNIDPNDPRATTRAEQILTSACPYTCTKFEKHSDLKNPISGKLHVKDEYDDRLNWQVSGKDFYVERKDNGNTKETLRKYRIYYYSESSIKEFPSGGIPNLGECFTLDSYHNSVSAFTKVYSKEKIKELQEMIDNSEEGIGLERFKEEVFNFPKTSNFKVILDNIELKTSEVPEKTVVNAREVLVEVLIFEDINGREILRKDLEKLSILVW